MVAAITLSFGNCKQEQILQKFFITKAPYYFMYIYDIILDKQSTNTKTYKSFSLNWKPVNNHKQQSYEQVSFLNLHVVIMSI